MKVHFNVEYFFRVVKFTSMDVSPPVFNLHI